MAVFLELLVKSGLIAAIGLLLAFAARAPRERVDILRVATGLIALLPVALAIGPRLSLAWLKPVPAEMAPAVDFTALPLAETSEPWRLNLAPVADIQLGGLAPLALTWEALAALAYGLVAAVLIGRFALGVLTLSRWTSDGEAAPEGVWTETLRRLGGAKARLVVASRVETPLSWGPPPGVILIQPRALARPDQATAVLAHELAHIRRGDWLFLALSRLAVALFWFNPLVWVLHQQLAARTEDAADAAALGAVEPRDYARTLVDLAVDVRHPAALAMAGDSNALSRRIARIMTTERKSASRPLMTALAVGALVGVATPLAAVELTRRDADEPRTVRAPFAPLAPVAPAASQDPSTAPAPPQGWGEGHVYFRDVLDDDAKRAIEQARVHAEEAHRHAAKAHEEARRAMAGIDHAAIERAVAEAQRVSAQARVQAQHAREQARHAMAEARVQMREGADHMDEGAQTMREEAQRLRDPAYRAKVIAENRERGSTVTDAELVELSRTLPGQADDMERQAQNMREQADREMER